MCAAREQPSATPLLAAAAESQQSGSGDAGSWRVVTRLSMFMDGFSTAFWSPLAATILHKTSGVSTTIVGFILTASSLSNIPASSLISYVADRTARHTGVNRLALFLPLLPAVVLSMEVNYLSSGDASFVPLVVLTVVLINCLGGAAVLPMLSAATMSRLDKIGQKNQFGSFFIFRALGWSSGSVVGGLLYQYGLHLGDFHLEGSPAVVVAGLVVARGLQFVLSLCLLMPTGGYETTAAREEGREKVAEDLVEKRDTHAEQNANGSDAPRHVNEGGDFVVVEESEKTSLEQGEVAEHTRQHSVVSNKSKELGPLKHSGDFGVLKGSIEEEDLLIDESITAREDPKELTEDPKELRELVSVGELLYDRHVLIFLASMAVNGVAGATYDNYVILFAKETLHADGLVLGLMTTATGVANTVMWTLQPYLLETLGPRMLLVVAMGSTVLRMWLYTIVQGQWPVVAVQLLHGVSWVCVWSGGTAFMHEVSPPHLRATSQAILSAVYAGFGASAGLMLGGWLYSSLGPISMFRLQAVVIGCVGLSYLFLEALPHWNKERHKAIDE